LDFTASLLDGQHLKRLVWRQVGKLVCCILGQGFMVSNILTVFVLPLSATKFGHFFLFRLSCSQLNWNRLPNHYDFNVCLFCFIFILLSQESDGGAIFWKNLHPLRSCPFSSFQVLSLTSYH